MQPTQTILLVEDNQDDVLLMKRALARAGISNPLQVVEDWRKAIEYLDGAGHYKDRKRYPYPGVVFLDLMLPHLNGFDVLHWLNERSDLFRPVVVVLSSSNSPADMERVKKLGAALYAIKPPDAALFNQVSECCGIQWAQKAIAHAAGQTT